MKKNNFLTLILFTFSMYGQVTNYSFNSFNGSYNPITGTQIIAPGVDDGNSSATNIGFDFVFNGTAFTQFVASSNGCIRLGSSAPSSSSSAISSTSNSNMIAFFSRDGKAVGGVFYEITGTAPNRVLTIQYSSYAPVYSATSNIMDAQILLYESSNQIEIIYGSSTTSSSTTGQVGIRGTTTSSDYQNRSTSSNWSSTIAGTSNSSTVTFSSTVSPVSGLTFRWSPPAPCQAPVDQATSLTFGSISNSSISGSFTAAASAPSGYLVVRSTSATPPTPTDGTTYSTGSTSLGTGTSVVQTSSATSFTNSSLTGNTTYYYYIFSYNNTSCSGGPIYLSASPLSLSTTTCASAPSVSAATSISTNGFTSNWSASNGGASSYLLYLATDNSFINIVSGYNGIDVGNVTTYEVTGLSASTTYYYRLVAVGSSCNSSNSSTIIVSTSCEPEIAPTQVQDFSTFTGAAPAPICWSESSGALTSSSTLSGTTSNWLKKSNGFANANSSNVGASINLYNNSTNWLISNEIDLGNTVGLYQLKYKYAVTSYNGTSSVSTLSSHKVDVVVSTDGGATWSNTNIIKSYAGSGTYSNTGAFETVLLSQYSGVVKIAFVATCISSSDIDFHIDDFQIELAPTCIPPTALSSSNISYQTATIGWTAPSTGTTPSNYDYEVRTSGAPGSGSSGLVASATVSTTSASISGLTGSTAYSYYVRSSCGNGDYSTWANGSLTTSSCAIPTSVSASSITATSAVISWIAPTGSPTGYEYEIRTSGSAGSGATGFAFSGTITAPTTSVSLTGLSPANTYFVYIRTNCYSGFNSSWTSVYNLVTLCAATTQFNLTFEGSSSLPACTNLFGGGSVTSTAYEGSNCLGINPLATYVLPEVSNYNNNTHQLSFYMRTWSGNNQIAVGYLTDPTDVNTFVSLSSFSITNTYQKFTYTPSNLPNNVYLCLKSLDTYYTNRIDNIVWDLIPTIVWANQSWSNTTGPTQYDNAELQDNLIVNSDIICKDLMINTGKSLTIAPGMKLKITGNLINNGSVFFKSDATGSGMFDAFTGTITGNGNVQVERYIPSKRAFRFVSPSVNTTSTIRENWQENGGTTAGLGTHITGAGGATNGFDVTATNNPSMFGFNHNTGQWAAVANTNVNTLTAGTPYRLMVRGDRTTDLTTNTPASSVTTLRATGALHTGDFTPTLNQAAEGFSFIGNPYQAPLDMEAVLTNSATNMNTDVLYYWDPTLNTRGAYVTRTLSANTNNVSSSFTEILQPGQAVFVKKDNTATAATMTISETHKNVAAGAAGVFRTSANNTQSNAIGLLRANLQASIDNEWQTTDAALALFDSSYTWDVTQEDASKMNNLDEEVSFVQNNTSLAIAKQNDASVTDELPIRLQQLRHTDYRWVFDLTNYNGNTPYLLDTEQNTLNVIENGTVFPFTAGSNATNRFKIVFQNSTLSADDFANNIKLYPNPTKSGASFYVAGIKEATVLVYNVVGQNIPVTVVSQGNAIQVTPTATLSQGIYLVSVTTTDGKTAQVKWIVE